MKAGLLKNLIEIYSPTIKINEYGEQINEYEYKLTTRARITNKSGNREMQNGEIFYDYKKQIEVRIYIDVNEFDRIKHNNKFYRILDIEPNKDLNELIINVELVND